jgi:predicted DNA-binding transcriptional regulator AlpA
MQDLIVTMTKGDLEKIIEDRLRYCFLTFLPNEQPKAQKPDTEQLLNKKQAAKLIGVCQSTIDNHARAGNLTRRYIGKAVRFSRDEVLHLAQEKTPRKAGESMLNGKKRRA